MRCLVIQTAFLGDVVLTVPLLRLLRESAVVDRTYVLTAPPGPELLRGQDLADEIIVFDKRGGDRGPLGTVGVASRVRKLGIDAALIPHRSFRSALIAWLAGVPTRVGFDESGGRAFLTEKVPYRARSHEVERIAALASAIGVELPAAPLPFSLKPSDGARSALDAALEGAGINPGTEVIAVAPGSRWRTKQWPAERFAQASSELASMTGARVIIAGSAADRDVSRALATSLKTPGVDLAGSLPIDGLVALAARARLVLSNDSAVAHIAAGVGTPVVVVFGPTVPSQGFAPYTDCRRVLGADLECRPCGRHGGERCRRGDLACMNMVTVEAVVAAAAELISREGPC
jgi:heptosyltransferase II